MGEALDPLRRRLVGIDFLGGEPDDGAALRPVTTHDQARAVAAVLDAAGIRRADFVGASYGGMVALAFAEHFPERVLRLTVLCAAHRTHPMATALRSLQRSAVRLGAASGRSREGLSLARALAMTTYRSAEEFEERFSTLPLPGGRPPNPAGRAATAPDHPARFPVEEYLDARGADFARRFDAERFLSLSESIDLHQTDPRAVPPDTLLVSADSDTLVPPWLVERLAQRAGSRARHVTLESPFGHDAFLKETEVVSALIRAELGTVQAEAGAAERELGAAHAYLAAVHAEPDAAQREPEAPRTRPGEEESHAGRGRFHAEPWHTEIDECSKYAEPGRQEALQ